MEKAALLTGKHVICELLKVEKKGFLDYSKYLLCRH